MAITHVPCGLIGRLGAGRQRPMRRSRVQDWGPAEYLLGFPAPVAGVGVEELRVQPMQVAVAGRVAQLVAFVVVGATHRPMGGLDQLA